MRIVSWNVNGIRALVRKGFFEWLEQTRPDVLCLQETKADPAALGEEILVPLGYHSYWAVAQRKGYSGVATFCREEPVNCQIGLGIPRFDSEGRVVVTDLGPFELYNVYFPNSGMGPERLAYKLDFFDAFLNHLNERLKSGKPVIFCGDVNAAHKEIDIARPKENAKTAGFMPEERAWVDRYIENGWLDTFRHFYPDARDVYTWWDQRFNARSRNIGWRIDYFFIHQQHIGAVKATGVTPEVEGSDHCPVWIEVDETAFGTQESGIQRSSLLSGAAGGRSRTLPLFTEGREYRRTPRH